MSPYKSKNQDFGFRYATLIRSMSARPGVPTTPGIALRVVRTGWSQTDTTSAALVDIALDLQPIIGALDESKSFQRP
jgi:hypothetical protein